jgi:hypothetical protein
MTPQPARLPQAQSASTSVTKADAYRLHQALGQLKGAVSEPRHVYTLVLLRKKLQAEADTIDELNKPPARIQEAEAKRLELCKEYSSKDAAGNPAISADRNFIIDPVRLPEFQARITALQLDYRQDIEAHQVAQAKIAALLREPSETAIVPSIPLSALTGSISVEHMEALFPLLIDDAGAASPSAP